MSAATTTLPRRAFVEQIMGLPISVHVRGPQAAGRRAATALASAFDSLRTVDRVFSTFRSDSAVALIRTGAVRLEDAEPAVREVAELCREAERRTGGRFRAWLPDAAGVERFEPTGLVKGWAIERACNALVAALPEHDVLICAGGDIAAACSRLDTPDWVVGVEDPRDPTAVLLTVPLRTGAVATSGNAARGPHIVNPRTGRHAGGLLSATVVGPSLLWADVYATAAFVAGPDAAAWVSSLPEHPAVLVDLDGGSISPPRQTHPYSPGR